MRRVDFLKKIFGIGLFSAGSIFAFTKENKNKLTEKAIRKGTAFMIHGVAGADNMFYVTDAKEKEILFIWTKENTKNTVLYAKDFKK